MDLMNKIYTGHALDVLKTFPNESINMCITSPPYWGLRDYNTQPAQWNDGWQGELGAEPDFNQYINHLCDIFDEVKRVLRADGTCWVNIGDSYKNKSLSLIPYKFVIEMQHRGWIVRNVIIWQKPKCLPTSAKDRFTMDFEYLFFFVKNNKYYFQQQFEDFAPSTLNRSMYNFTENKSLHYRGLSKEKQRIFHNKVLNNELEGRNMRCIWKISPVVFHGAHFATFPPKLVETPIKAGCPEDGIVLDPFIGSGTTAVVCQKLNRNWVGIELNPEYTKLADERISNNK